jgi:ketosteroid isomerase-like protein
MSQENVEIVRRAYEVLNAGGTIDDLMDGLRPLLDPQVEWVNPPDALERGTRAGLDGWRVALENILAGLGENVKLEVQGLVEHGDAVLATGKAHVSGTSSGVETVGPTWAAIWTVTDGRIRRYEWSWDLVAMRARFKSMERVSE